MEDIFKALSDKHRLQLLDALKEEDGRSLGELETVLPHLTRFGVMKHLKVLEEALLIQTRKVGRFKYHYLNTVPLQEISDRWISRFAAPFSEGLVDLKNNLERVTIMDAQTKPKHVFTTIIQSSVEDLWSALTEPSEIQKYFFGLNLKTDWKKDNEIRFVKENGDNEIIGKVLEVVPMTKLAHTFKGVCTPGQENDAPSRVTYEIENLGKACKLTLVHDEFDGETETYKNTGGGWPTVLSGLKTLLETGRPLEIAS